ncbi:carbamate kinase [Anaeromicrobium sediminis]|uniref:Carbamate kinase n=2 Tax=Anaeromicrobium sediminis TaxID=1478221 RepID=A0A267MEY8_9FIRM|nr:carbamate kinase [Anaeromicrobium sediminis]
MFMKIVVALGGNALQEGKKAPTALEQLNIIKETSKHICDLIEEGHQLVIAHGNGPQVGRILLQNEQSKNEIPPMSLDVCGAMTQGMIGYHLQQAIGEELQLRNIDKKAISIVTQVVVDKNDKAFKNPTKPIGQFYSKEEADILIEEKEYTMTEDAGRGYRRVVPSPVPKEIVEIDVIKKLVDEYIVITVGGGGIPVIKENTLKGVEAVIDKDLASEKLAEDLDADILLILTAVEKVALNFGKKDEMWLDSVSVKEANRFVAEGHFAKGSMLPKINAAVKFASSKKGRKAIIASLNKGSDAVKGKSGTVVEI